MVSLTARRVLRLHRGLRQRAGPGAPAIVRFLDPRVPRVAPPRRPSASFWLSRRGIRAAAGAPPRQRAARARAICVLLQRLEPPAPALNAQHFGGALGAIPIRLSGRMRTRLGELAVDLRTGRPTEIAISRRHIAAAPVGRGRAHPAARDGAPVAGGDRPGRGPRPDLPPEGGELGIEPQAAPAPRRGADEAARA